MTISTSKITLMTFSEKKYTRSKIVTNNITIEHLSRMSHLYQYDIDIQKQINKFGHICDTTELQRRQIQCKM